jgi:hypothetical protein
MNAQKINDGNEADIENTTVKSVQKTLSKQNKKDAIVNSFYDMYGGNKQKKLKKKKSSKRTSKRNTNNNNNEKEKEKVKEKEKSNFLV